MKTRKIPLRMCVGCRQMKEKPPTVGHWRRMRQSGFFDLLVLLTMIALVLFLCWGFGLITYRATLNRHAALAGGTAATLEEARQLPGFIEYNFHQDLNLIAKNYSAFGVIALIIVANALGINTSSLVALVSVVGLALSLSVQNILSNLFTGLTLLITKPFAAGDFVEVAGKTGLVKTVGLFYTQLDTLDNVAVSIPNADVTASSVSNYSREELRRVDRTFTTSYDCSTDEVKAAIADAIAKDARILTDPAPFVRLLDYKGSTVEYVVRVWCKGPDYWDVYFALNENVRESFAARGVKFSYEHVNVHIVEK